MDNSHKTRVFFWQKIIATVCGLLFSIVILEIGLRIQGFIFSSLQESRNTASFRKGGSYKIICLGDSTTAGQYPRFLEEALNKNDTGRNFSVIDKGIVGVNSGGILSVLESNLNKYQPNMAIVMMGYNDRFLVYYKDIPEANTKLFEYCRTYRLLRFIYKIMVNRLERNSIHVPGKVENIDKDRIIKVKWLFKKAIELSPKNDWAYFVLGCAYKRDGRLVEAKQALQKAMVLNPKDAIVYNMIYHKEDKLFWPEGVLRKAIELSPKNDGICVALGMNCQIEGRLSEAEDFYKKAIELNPENDMAYFGLGFVYHMEGRFLEAESLVKKAIELNPKNAWAYVILGEVYNRTDRPAKVEELFRKAVELSPNGDVWAYDRLGSFLFKEGRFSESEEVLKKAIELNPGEAGAYLSLGFKYQVQGRFSESEEVIKKAIELDLDDDIGYRALANLYRQDSKDDLAGEYDKKVSELSLGEYSPVTVSSYHKLKEALDERGIKLVCVQYPMRSIGLLKKIFTGYDGIIFVDNEMVFKKKVKEEGYWEYFVDVFGGDFGHCTNKGNRLLAENIADVILKEMFHRQ